MKDKPELLSPAGNMEKLVAAVTFGADAVYFGGEAFGLRAKAGNFTLDEIQAGMDYLHERGKKGYLTVNAYARDKELSLLEKYLVSAAHANVDAFIISDPGVFSIAKKVAPDIPRFISTQANTTNSSAVNFWADQGASRAILARELSKDELESIIRSSSIETECFIHGAVCISYSGRCLISAYMAGKDANRGECTQPCRWNYLPPSETNYVIQEATRPLQEMEIAEDKDGTYLYNAKDLCLIKRVGELVDMGAASFKIEGRMKSVMYVAVTTGVYRKAIDLAAEDPSGYVADRRWIDLLSSISNRHYTEGFYAGVPDREAMNYETSAYVRTSDFLGVVTGGKGLTVACRGKFSAGEELQLLTPTLDEYCITPSVLRDNSGQAVQNSRAGDILLLEGADVKVPEGTLLRRMTGDSNE